MTQLFEAQLAEKQVGLGAALQMLGRALHRWSNVIVVRCVAYWVASWGKSGNTRKDRAR